MRTVNLSLFAIAALISAYLFSVPMALSGYPVVSGIGQPVASAIYPPMEAVHPEAPKIIHRYFAFWCDKFAACEVQPDNAYVSYAMR